MSSGAPPITLTLKMGPTVPETAPAYVVRAIESVQVTHKDDGRSGFQITLIAGRGTADILDDPLLVETVNHPFSRVQIAVTFVGETTVLMDGFITDQQFAPSETPGATRLTLTGEDVSFMMDRQHWTIQWPLSEVAQVAAILAKYSVLGVVPVVIPPRSSFQPIPNGPVPTQAKKSDRDYLVELARYFGYVFYVTPGPILGTNTAYWGPPFQTVLVDQAPLTFNMGASSNVLNVSFQYNPTEVTLYAGMVQSELFSPPTIPIATIGTLRRPMARKPALDRTDYLPYLKTAGLDPKWGDEAVKALLLAQGATDKSTEKVATASGEVDVIRYGAVLQSRTMVNLRGAGDSFDGTWFVKSVTHNIKRGEYRQQFSLSREGLGALSQTVSV